MQLPKKFQKNSFLFSNDRQDTVKAYQNYLDLMSHWHQQLPGFIYDQHYEQRVSQPRQTLIKLLIFCELNLRPECEKRLENKVFYGNLIGISRRHPAALAPLQEAF